MKKFGLFEYNNKWFTKDKLQEIREIELGLTDNFSKMTGYEFEDFIEKLFKKMRYRVRNIKHSGDEGVDLMAYKGRERISIQTKRWKNGLARSREVQIVLGTLVSKKATRSIIITTSRFTRQAVKLAKRNSSKIELWDKEKLHKMVRKYFIDVKSPKKA